MTMKVCNYLTKLPQEINGKKVDEEFLLRHEPITFCESFSSLLHYLIGDLLLYF